MSDDYKSGAQRLGIDWKRLQPQDKTEQSKPEVLELWAEHHNTWDVLMHCAHRWEWITPGMAAAVRVGLPRTDVLAVVQLLRLPRGCWAQVLEGIRLAEDEALSVWDAARDKRS